MKKLIFIFLSLLVTSACARNDDFIVAKFLGFVQDEDRLLFKRGKTRLMCKFSEVTLISEKQVAKCIKDKKDLKTFKKDQKNMIEKFLVPTQRYFIKIRAEGKNELICDISTEKSNLGLDLVRAGLAMPKNDDKEAFVKASVLAIEGEKGFFGKKYSKVSKCAFGIKDEPKSKPSEPKKEPSAEQPAPKTEEPTPNKPTIEMSINE